MKKILLVAIAPVIAVLLGVPGVSLYYEADGGRNCTSCHEMQAQFENWHASSHRSVSCGKCHGDALTADASFHMNNVKRAVAHMRGDLPERVVMPNRFVQSMVEQCRNCHRQEFASWSAGPHSATYSRIFLDGKHNAKIALMDDCLRCHGMHFEGSVSQLVAPLDRTGPWRMVAMELNAKPTMPCTTCHNIHLQGPETKKVNVEGRVAGPQQPVATASLAFYDRRTGSHIPVTELPLPLMSDGTRLVKTSNDSRQALCYQCHAPTSTLQVGSGDDRTPIGVHEGISCLACHDQHGQHTRASCASCHPKMSNCGLDVEKMDTTFLSTHSKHNIHWVKCVDCHPGGVPKPATSGASGPLPLARASIQTRR